MRGIFVYIFCFAKIKEKQFGKSCQIYEKVKNLIYWQKMFENVFNPTTKKNFVRNQTKKSQTFLYI